MGIEARHLLAFGCAGAVMLGGVYLLGRSSEFVTDERAQVRVQETSAEPVPAQSQSADAQTAIGGDPSVPGMTPGNPINVSAQVLGFEYETNAVKANDAYADIFMRIRGLVESVDEGGYGHEEEAVIRFNRLGIGARVVAYVPRDEGAQVQAMRGVELVCLGARKQVFVELNDCKVSKGL